MTEGVRTTDDEEGVEHEHGGIYDDERLHADAELKERMTPDRVS
jgi:hypothetical protein